MRRTGSEERKQCARSCRPPFDGRVALSGAAGGRGIGCFLPDAADAGVGFGTEVEPRGLVVRRIADEQHVELAEFLDERLADLVDRHVAREQPGLRHDRHGGTQIEDLFLKTGDRTRFHVGDDYVVRAFAGDGRLFVAAKFRGLFVALGRKERRRTRGLLRRCRGLEEARQDRIVARGVELVLLVVGDERLRREAAFAGETLHLHERIGAIVLAGDADDPFVRHGSPGMIQRKLNAQWLRNPCRRALRTPSSCGISRKSPMDYQFCKVEREGRLAVVTLNRPEVMNALHAEAHEELDAVFNDFAAGPEQWVAIVTGAGDRAFSAGNDLKVTAAGRRKPWPANGCGGRTQLFDRDKPVIAAVNGIAMGGGFEIALACDIIVAAENAVFALPEPRVGLAALAGGIHPLPREIGAKQALGMILTGRRVSAAEGQTLGFVNEVVPAAELMAAAKRWARLIMEASPMSVRASKQAVYRGLGEASLADALANQSRYPAVAAMYRSEDMKK